MVDRLAIFAVSPTRKMLPQRLDCMVLSLYRPPLPNNLESLKFFPDDKGICTFL
jgi:hypothetical protein